MPNTSQIGNIKQETVNKESLKFNISSFKLKFAFSLVEILVTVFIVMILGTILLTTSGTIAQRFRINLQSIAARIGSKEIERLRNLDYASLPASGSFSNSEITSLPSGTAYRNVSNYQSSPDIKLINITISWLLNGVNRQISMETLIYQYGI